MLDGGVFAHPSAVVDDGANIADGVRLWHHVHVRSGATIGKDTQLGGNVYVDTGVVIGARVKIQNNALLYSGVTIDDDVFIGPSATFTNDRFPRAFGAWEVVETHVQLGASVGANATIVCGVQLGRYSVVAAGAVVTKTVEPHEIVAGNPARHHGWVCRCGRVTSRAATRPEELACGVCQWDGT